MSGFSDDRKNQILDASFGGAAYSEEEKFKLHLVTVHVTGAMKVVGELTEPTWTGYAAQPMKDADWNASESGVKTNLTEMDFPEATAGSDTHNGWAVVNEKGEIVQSGTVPPTFVTTGITPKFKPGALSFSLLDS